MLYCTNVLFSNILFTLSSPDPVLNSWANSKMLSMGKTTKLLILGLKVWIFSVYCCSDAFLRLDMKAHIPAVILSHSFFSSDDCFILSTELEIKVHKSRHMSFKPCFQAFQEEEWQITNFVEYWNIIFGVIAKKRCYSRFGRFFQLLYSNLRERFFSSHQKKNYDNSSFLMHASQRSKCK